MNEPPTGDERADGYVRTWRRSGSRPRSRRCPGERCSTCAPRRAARPRRWPPVARSSSPPISQMHRARLIRLASSVVVADATAPPFASVRSTRCSLDAPCCGLGALRRRADARWRITETTSRSRRAAAPDHRRGRAARAPGRSVDLQRVHADRRGIDRPPHPGGFEIDAAAPPAEWRPFGHGWRAAAAGPDTDGMVLIRYRRTP